MLTMARTLQVRDVPEQLHAELKARAAALGLSLSDYLLNVLTDVASKPPIAETLRRAMERGGRGDITTDDIVEIIRRNRDGH